MFPILVFVGLEITAQSFQATPTRHYPALALAVLPALVCPITIPAQRRPRRQLADPLRRGCASSRLPRVNGFA